MAAGMGSRFGGLKQAAKFGNPPKTMLDFSIGDAMEAGFEKIVFVIRKDIESAFRESVSAKYEKLADVRYVFQEACGAKLPEGRTKPWGTGHAVLACSRRRLRTVSGNKRRRFLREQSLQAICRIFGKSLSQYLRSGWIQAEKYSIKKRRSVSRNLFGRLKPESYGCA